VKSKRVSESKITLVQQMLPQDTNPAGNVHGGVMLKLIDTAGGVCATRHVRANVVTASIDRLDFLEPVYVGDLVHVHTSVNYVGTKSMEVGVRVEAENLYTGECRHTATAYLTFVSLDETGRPQLVPQLIAETEDEKRRMQEAQERRKQRLAERKKEKAAQEN